MKRWHYDVDGDGTLESASGDADPQYWFCYDESWRIVAAYRKTDAAPKERFVYHAAGLGGFGDGSYIDAVVLREKDANSGWNAASDTLEQRIYYLQNWRADVVALMNDFGLPLEYVRYSPYGVPRRVPLADYNDDGVVDSFDYDDLASDWDDETYRRAADVNLDGVVDSFDIDDFLSDYYATLDYGRGVLTGDPMDGGVGNRKGYAGYEFEPALAGIDDDSDSPDDPTALYHVRHRVYDAARGTWTRRDPLGYVDGINLQSYCNLIPTTSHDPFGLSSVTSAGCVPPASREAIAAAQSYLLTIQHLTDAEIARRMVAAFGLCVAAEALGTSIDDLRHRLARSRPDAIPVPYAPAVPRPVEPKPRNQWDNPLCRALRAMIIASCKNYTKHYRNCTNADALAGRCDALRHRANQAMLCATLRLSEMMNCGFAPSLKYDWPRKPGQGDRGHWLEYWDEYKRWADCSKLYDECIARKLLGLRDDEGWLVPQRPTCASGVCASTTASD